MIEALKIKKEISSFILRNERLSHLNFEELQFSSKDYLQYEEFRELLKQLDLLDGNKVNPVQDFLVGQMWVKELQASDKCCVFNIFALLSAILKLQMQGLIIDSASENSEEYKPSPMGSAMLFTKQG